MRFIALLLLTTSATVHAAEPIDLTVDGEQWTFRTPAPDHLSLRPEHPRLFITTDNVDAYRAKWHDPEEQPLRETLSWRQPMTYRALQYVLLDDAEAGADARDALLAGPQRFTGVTAFQWLCVYDWTHDLYTSAQREQAFVHLCFLLNMDVPSNDVGECEAVQWGSGFPLGNDSHEPKDHQKGYLLQPILALAFHGDGVRDAWCDRVIQEMLGQCEGDMYPIYDPVSGGLLDGHNVWALNGGGVADGESRGDRHAIGGYSNFYPNGAHMLMGAWNSAMGDDLFRRDNFYRMLPHHVLYRMHGRREIGINDTTQSVAIMAGVYREIDPDMAGLAEWLARKYSRGKYLPLSYFLLGSLKTPPRSPDEIGLPTSTFIDGADRFYSRSSWDDDVVVVEMSARTNDLHRCDASAGMIYVSKGEHHIWWTSGGRKARIPPFQGSGLVAWDTETQEKLDQTPTTWTANRAIEAPYQWATDPLYRGRQPAENHGTDEYHVFRYNTSDEWVGHREEWLGVTHERTLVHLKPSSGRRECIVVRDTVSVQDHLDYCVTWLIDGELDLSDDRYTLTFPDGLVASVQSFGGQYVREVGPMPAEEVPYTGLIGPYDGPKRRYVHLIADDQNAGEYVTVMQIGDPSPVAYADGKLQVDGWTVEFGDVTSVNGETPPPRPEPEPEPTPEPEPEPTPEPQPVTVEVEIDGKMYTITIEPKGGQ